MCIADVLRSCDYGGQEEFFREAADRIEELESENERLKAALEIAKTGIGRMRKADTRAYIGPEYQSVLDEIHKADSV